VLDSSFNPPSRAHRWIAKDAILEVVKQRISSESPWEGLRLILLLATQNADKPSKPAAFEDRLAMMYMMARELYAELVDAHKELLRESGNDDGQRHLGLGFFMIDVGVIKQPYFVDKAAAIDESGVYGDKERFEQVHLTGFDTLTRIFDKKYYGEEGFGVLEPFLRKGRVRAVLRPGDSWGGIEEQREYVERMRRGEREEEGVKAEWGERVDLVEGGKEAVGVSSTKVREAVKSKEWKVVEELVGKEIGQWIQERNLYIEEG
jgi:nicotinamide-nucleotide adenylyltransferase